VTCPIFTKKPTEHQVIRKGRRKNALVVGDVQLFDSIAAIMELR
jgi:hypothetical protein